MTDSNGQQQMLDAIERLLAGETVDSEGMPDEERRRLLDLARDLRDGRPQPSAQFAERLEMKIMQEAAATGAHGRMPDKVKAAGDKSSEVKHRAAGHKDRRWLPPWFTLRRMAAVTAALVIGLGIVGITNAIIGEGGNGVIDNGRVAGVSGEKAATPEGDALESMRIDGEAADAVGSPAGSGAQDASGAGSAGTTGEIPSVRKVIRTADYEIEVPAGEFQEKYGKVTDLAARYGGYVVSADTTASDEEGAIDSGTITIRIADVDGNFEAAMSELDELGTVVSRDVSGEDVTDQYVDLQSRLRNAQAHEASLLDLMARAVTVDEMLMVESELNVVRSEIEQLQGQINYIEHRADYATISVKLREEDAAADDADGDDGLIWGFTDALRYSGWLAVQTVNFVIMALGVVIPVALLLTLFTVVVYRLMQRRKQP